MSFQSYFFALFLLAVLCFYYTFPAKLRLWVLLLANFIFFGWADLRAVVWLGICIVTTWGTGIFLEKNRGKRTAGVAFALCLTINLGLLAVFKYFPVWDRLLNAAFGQGVRVVHLDMAERFGLVTPLGISFYTLQAVGYLTDVAVGRYGAEKNLGRYAAFLSFFPTIASGPIERGGNFFAQLDRILRQRRRELLDYDRMMRGLISVLLGFFMKLVVAERAALLVNYLYSVYQDGNSFTMVVGAIFYSIQIYCDFASYSLIALGTAALMGIELMQNFRQPYFALGISDFWRRWHISLSSWLRDYVYIPLGGNRRGALRRYVNLLAVFFVSGLWHGGAPTFLVWGLLHGLCQILEDLYRKMRTVIWKKKALPLAGLRSFLGRVFTFCTVSLLWIFFRSDSLEMAKVCLTNLFTRWQGFLYVREFLFNMGLDRNEFIIVVVSVLFLLILELISEKKNERADVWIYAARTPVRWGLCFFMMLGIFVFGMYGPGFDASNFIYVNF